MNPSARSRRKVAASRLTRAAAHSSSSPSSTRTSGSCPPRTPVAHRAASSRPVAAAGANRVLLIGACLLQVGHLHTVSTHIDGADECDVLAAYRGHSHPNV